MNKKETEKHTLSIIKAQYLASAVRKDQYPELADDDVEIAFVGRSNVGKSSLLNTLSRHGGLARVSGTPGKTQTLNFYQLTAKLSDTERKNFYLVDLPGYGYAKTGHAARRQWAKFIEEYLITSPRLKLICQLIDIRHNPMESDILSYQWLTSHQLPVQVVATKADKIPRSQLAKHMAAIRNGLTMQSGTILPFSSLKGSGRDELLDVIGKILLH